MTSHAWRFRAITAGNEAILAAFSCGDADLDEFLRDDALRLDDARAARTWLALYDDVLVGYITLLCDAIVLETRERKGLALRHEDHPVIPALKVARLGVSETFRATHRGVSEALMQFAFATALSLSARRLPATHPRCLRAVGRLLRATGVRTKPREGVPRPPEPEHALRPACADPPRVGRGLTAR